MSSSSIRITALPVFLIVFSLPGSQCAATIVKEGRATAVIAVPTKPDDHEKRAIQDLSEHIEKLSGAKLESSTVDADDVDAFLAQAKKAGRIPIFLGRNVRERLVKLLPTDSVRGAFILRVNRDAVMIAGVDEGTYYGVIELLEQLGCRWFMPGDLGAVIPQLKTIEVREQQTVQRPSFPSRWFQMPHRDWQMHLRCGGTRHRRPCRPGDVVCSSGWSGRKFRKLPRPHADLPVTLHTFRDV